MITDASDSQEWVSQPDIMRFYKTLRLNRTPARGAETHLPGLGWSVQGRPVSVGKSRKPSAPISPLSSPLEGR
jgi:hypothetical protein